MGSRGADIGSLTFSLGGAHVADADIPAGTVTAPVSVIRAIQRESSASAAVQSRLLDDLANLAATKSSDEVVAFLCSARGRTLAVNLVLACVEVVYPGEARVGASGIRLAGVLQRGAVTSLVARQRLALACAAVEEARRVLGTCDPIVAFFALHGGNWAVVADGARRVLGDAAPGPDVLLGLAPSVSLGDLLVVGVLLQPAITGGAGDAGSSGAAPRSRSASSAASETSPPATGGTLGRQPSATRRRLSLSPCPPVASSTFVAGKLWSPVRAQVFPGGACATGGQTDHAPGGAPAIVWQEEPGSVAAAEVDDDGAVMETAVTFLGLEPFRARLANGGIKLDPLEVVAVNHLVVGMAKSGSRRAFRAAYAMLGREPVSVWNGDVLETVGRGECMYLACAGLSGVGGEVVPEGSAPLHLRKLVTDYVEAQWGANPLLPGVLWAEAEEVFAPSGGLRLRDLLGPDCGGKGSLEAYLEWARRPSSYAGLGELAILGVVLKKRFVVFRPATAGGDETSEVLIPAASTGGVIGVGCGDPVCGHSIVYWNGKLHGASHYSAYEGPGLVGDLQEGEAVPAALTVGDGWRRAASDARWVPVPTPAGPGGSSATSASASCAPPVAGEVRSRAGVAFRLAEGPQDAVLEELMGSSVPPASTTERSSAAEMTRGDAAKASSDVAAARQIEGEVRARVAAERQLQAAQAELSGLPPGSDEHAAVLARIVELCDDLRGGVSSVERIAQTEAARQREAVERAARERARLQGSGGGAASSCPHVGHASRGQVRWLYRFTHPRARS